MTKWLKPYRLRSAEEEDDECKCVRGGVSARDEVDFGSLLVFYPYTSTHLFLPLKISSSKSLTFCVMTPSRTKTGSVPEVERRESFYRKRAPRQTSFFPGGAAFPGKNLKTRTAFSHDE